MNLVKDTVADLKGIPKENDLVDMLRKEVLEVTFNKLDGEERIMTCVRRWSNTFQKINVLKQTNLPKKERSLFGMSKLMAGAVFVMTE